ncbi:SigmaW regulon antibacterial [Pirellula sp. SH-Sr6A]|uniref:flotillin-like protein FloA n=1 Tax=Pirellula sp. SH-Sr6A TaxID=1632865 RepID=UPI00078B7130|nr:flotillin-like protein FloA [Pirellula sp. SH-Sr6A]AMV33559.1 SigmaW regulon antibacterial [Pirellula sp. SH-Sr6A]
MDFLFLAQNIQLDFRSILMIGLAIGAVVIGLIALVIFWNFGSLWLQAKTSGADVSMMSLIGMYLRQVRPHVIVNAIIMASQAGLDTNRRTGITTQDLEAHYLAEGNVMNVINAIIAAQRAGIDLDFERAAAIDLAGRDVLDAVKTSVHPRVIDCPDPRHSGNGFLSAIAKNGIELKVKARVTVRTNLAQLIGGATEETVIARVGESIISSIGSSENHLVVLENPNLITRTVLKRGLDNQTAFTIVSIDIAHIEVGQNIGARLRADQAEADVRMARAQAEQRRAEAIAQEQVMKAKVAENRSNLVLAEAEVPQAMAKAFIAGHFQSAT